MWRRRSPSGHYHDGLRGIGRALGETVARPAGCGGAEDRQDLDGRPGGGKHHRIGIDISCRQHTTCVRGKGKSGFPAQWHVTATATLALIAEIILQCCYDRLIVPVLLPKVSMEARPKGRPDAY